MKEQYEKPIAVSVEFKTNDVVCASGPVEDCDEINRFNKSPHVVNTTCVLLGTTYTN